jgi:(2Fe-2S) ferredoxin
MGKKDVARAAFTVFCCGGGDCAKAGGKESAKALRAEVRAAGLKDQVAFVRTECTGRCKDAPVAIICSGCGNASAEGAVCGAVWYRKLKAADAAELVVEHLQNNRPLAAKLMNRSDDDL